MKNLKFKKCWFVLPTVIISASALIFGVTQSPQPLTTNTSNSNQITIHSTVASDTLGTVIQPSTNYDSSLLASEFVKNLMGTTDLKSFLQFDGTSNLGYLTMTNLPEDSKLSLITSTLVSTFANGQVSFTLQASQYRDDAGLLVDAPKDFPIKLSFAVVNAKTQIQANTTYPKALTADTFRSFIANPDDTIKTNNISKFVSITSLPADSVLTIKQWTSGSSSSNVNFIIKASKAYDAIGMPIENAEFVIKLNLLNLSNGRLPPATNLVKLETFPTDANAVTFLSQIKNADGSINYPYLSNFIDLSTMPHEATLSQVGDTSSNPNTGNVIFTIQIRGVYEGDSQTPVDKLMYFRYDWVMRAKIGETTITNKTIVARELTVNQFLAKVAPSGVTNYDGLAEFIDLTSIPASATLSLYNVIKEPLSGNISFVLLTNQYFNSDSVIINGYKNYDVTLESSVTEQEKAFVIEDWVYYVIAFGSATVIAIIVFAIIKIRTKDNKKYFEFEDFEKQNDKLDSIKK